MNIKTNAYLGRKSKIPITLFLLCASVLASGLLSPYMTLSARDGITLCLNTVIPSVFPFMILSDILLKCADFESITPIKSLFEKLFKINGSAISAFIGGALCGFPIGAKLSMKLHRLCCP